MGKISVPCIYFNIESEPCDCRVVPNGFFIFSCTHIDEQNPTKINSLSSLLYFVIHVHLLLELPYSNYYKPTVVL